MDRFRSIEAFVRVAESQNFADAAQQLGVSRSVITTRVQQLEDFVKTPLFHRTTRSVRLSEIGRAFYRECADLVHRTGKLVDQMRSMKGSPSGVLRVHALPGFALGHFGSILREFQDRYPEIELDLVISDAIIDPVRDGFDCTLQIFEPVSNTLVVRRMFAWRPMFCASPGYIKKHGEPREPSELLGHRLGLYSRYPTRDRWVFHGRKKKTVLELKPFLRTNSVHLLRDYAEAEAGIVCIPTLVAAESLLAGRLRTLLPQHLLSPFWLCAAYPASHRGTLKLKLFLEALASGPPDEPPWERALLARGLIPAHAPPSH
jgi:DNA-binding transcriptional LysR family regulator